MSIILQSLSAGVALLLTYLTFYNANKVNQKANLYLGIFLICVFLLFLDDVFAYHSIYLKYPHFFGFVPVLALTLSPTLYLSVLHFVKPTEKWRWTNLSHFILLFLFLIIGLPFYFSTAAFKLESYQADTFMSHTIFNIIIPLFFLQAFFYSFLMLKKLKKHQENTLLYSAEETTIQLGWLRNFIIAFLVMMFFWLVDIIHPDFVIPGSFDIILFVGMFLLAHFSLRQKEIFPVNTQERAAVLELLIAEETSVSKSPPDLLSTPELRQLEKLLYQKMEEEKPYLENELNLPKLAEVLDIPAYKLSYLLNNHIGENFSTFINKYRAESAKQILSNPKMMHFSLIQVAYEAGYNSKTVFNTHFKRITGVSPSVYRKEFK